jgi:hypothetical protein
MRCIVFFVREIDLIMNVTYTYSNYFLSNSDDCIQTHENNVK